MEERDVTPVIVLLDRQRAYRVRDEDRKAILVGPGKATVPAWVAEHWGEAVIGKAAPEALSEGAVLASEPARAPFEAYEEMTVDEIIHIADTASDEVRAAVVAYESGRKRPRKTIIEELS